MIARAFLFAQIEQFPHLSPAGKVEAVLAMTKRPYSKGFVLELAEVDIHALDAETVRSIEAVFHRWAAAAETGSQDPLYWVPPEQQQAVIERINVEKASVARQLVRLALGQYGPQKPTS